MSTVNVFSFWPKMVRLWQISINCRSVVYHMTKYCTGPCKKWGKPGESEAKCKDKDKGTTRVIQMW